jgi:hypothetical protein
MSEPEQGAAAPAAHQIFIDPVAAYFKVRMEAAENMSLRLAAQVREADALIEKQRAAIDRQVQIMTELKEKLEAKAASAQVAPARKAKPKPLAAEKLN